MNIGIIGAGIAGLVLATELKARGISVQVFEKARGVSGRMSTRYYGDFEFDHGAQFLTASDQSFQAFVDKMVEEGVLAQWQPRTAEFSSTRELIKTLLSKKLYVGAPRMNSLAKHLAHDLDVIVGVRIADLRRDQGKWILSDEQDHPHGPFDFVLSTAPAPQAYDLFKNHFDKIETVLDSRMQGSFTLMLGFETPLHSDFDFARPHDSLLSTITLNSSKPGRADHVQCWVLQSDHDWSETHMEDDKNEVMKKMIEEAQNLTGLPFDQAVHKDIHRWRYAIAQSPLNRPFYLDLDLKLGLCGDWCAENKIEGAYQSAMGLMGGLNDYLK